MAVSARLCPLCDATMEALVCEIHGTPTLSLAPSTQPPVRLEMGTVIVGKYRVDSLLSQGGMGALLLATELAGGRRVVIKVLRGHRVTDPGNVRRFYQEARVASALHHPNIVRIFEFGVDEPTRAPFLAMEYVAGRTLKQIIQQEGPLDERRIGRLFAQIGRALVEAHDKGVLHRDLKPSNIMVVREGDLEIIKVLDFGLAKILEDTETAPLTVPGKTVGTPAFMAPEQVTQRAQDFRTDLYGLGCVLHATLTGSPPFTGEDLIEVMRRQVREAPPPVPSPLSDGKSPSRLLIEVHRALLEKQKTDRPRSTGEVVQMFEAMAESRAPKMAIADAGTIVDSMEITEAPDPATALSHQGLDVLPSVDTPRRAQSMNRIDSGDTVLSKAYAADPFSLLPQTIDPDPNKDDLETPIATMAMNDAVIDPISSGSINGVSSGSRSGLFEPELPSRVVARREMESALIATPLSLEGTDQGTDDPEGTEQGTEEPESSESGARTNFGLTPSLGTDRSEVMIDTNRERPSPRVEARPTTGLPVRDESATPAAQARSRSLASLVPEVGTRGTGTAAAEDSEEVWTSILPSTLDASELVDGMTPAMVEAVPSQIPAPPSSPTDMTEPMIAASVTPELLQRITGSDPTPRALEPPSRSPIDRPGERSQGDQGRARPSMGAGRRSGPAPERGKGVWGIVVSLTLATLLVGVTTYYTARRQERADSPPPPPPVVVDDPPPAPIEPVQPRIVPRVEPPPVTLVRVEIDSAPSKAEVYLDEQLLGLTPLPLEFPKGLVRPTVILKKRGYKAELVTLPIDSSAISVRLKKDR